MSMGSDLREAIIEDRVEERIQKMLESGELYTAEQMAEQMSKLKEVLIESNVEVVKRMIADGWSLDKSIQMIPSDIREKVRSRFKE